MGLEETVALAVEAEAVLPVAVAEGGAAYSVASTRFGSETLDPAATLVVV